MHHANLHRSLALISISTTCAANYRLLKVILSLGEVICVLVLILECDSRIPAQIIFTGHCLALNLVYTLTGTSVVEVALVEGSMFSTCAV